MKKHILLWILLTLGTAYSFAYGFTICGTVYDDSSLGGKNPLPGANVILKGTTTGVTTDFDGKFCIEVPDSLAVLQISSVGLATQEIRIGSKKNFEIRLLEDAIAIEEVVTIGYGVKREEDLTYSTTVIESAPAKDKPERSEEKVFIGKALCPKDIAHSGSSDKSIPKVDMSMSKLLTAGEVNDFSKWELWNDIAKKELVQFKDLWKFTPKERYSVQVVNRQNMPVINAEVFLLTKQNDTLWTARTDNTGKAELWAHAFSDNNENKYSIEVHYNNYVKRIAKAKEFHKKLNYIEIETDYIVPKTVDIAFVVDATGSMGDEIAYLKNDLASIMQQVNDTVEADIIRIGSVFYKDYGDDYVTKTKAFTTDVDSIVSFIANNEASGGGDKPEAVDDALEAAINNLTWNNNALSRIIFLILDAPPHNNVKNITKLQAVTKLAAQKGIRIVPVTCSGIDKSTEYLMRSIALFTNGTYSFLTDDSGIGGSHIKPTTDEYKVETFNDLVVRLLYQFTHTPTVPNNETLIAHDTTVIAEKLKSSDIEENPEANNENQILQWKYYPNPTPQFVHLLLPENIEDLYVCDISGKIVQRITVPSKKETISLEGLPLGIYYICFEDENGKKQKGTVMKVR